MTELTQLYTIAEHGRGDCWRTAFACVLDKQRPEEVPDFVYNADGTPNDNYFPDTVNWLWEQGYELQSVGLGQRPAGYEMAAETAERLKTESYVVTGRSPRKYPDGRPIYHACVRRGDGTIYDPHPEKNGLDGNPDSAWLLNPRSIETYCQCSARSENECVC
ncbi:hypothetical protein [Hymenobacter glacieicola]|uniref:Peptidase C39-like domain-containing protein n=1 Tax=Hymenobacter glacieicola TaxID=1562124 RepID=A0ABQ1X633_9BACT|nr:hypothetical protein [Hymenobacter glacieicola]GGG61279.1 hypothetical protein GCM10011378_41630 [Hymenobacter glacieicola]